MRELVVTSQQIDSTTVVQAAGAVDGNTAPRLLAEVRRFADRAPQSDDITIVTLQYAGA